MKMRLVLLMAMMTMIMSKTIDGDGDNRDDNDNAAEMVAPLPNVHFPPTPQSKVPFGSYIIAIYAIFINSHPAIFCWVKFSRMRMLSNYQALQNIILESFSICGLTAAKLWPIQI